MIVRETIRVAVAEALASLDWKDVDIVLERPRDVSHGDISTPVAMSLAKKLKRNPAEIAEAITEKLSLSENAVSSVEIMRPGFINFRFADSALHDNVMAVVDSAADYGRSDVGAGEKIQVEYVSANPTGPLVVVSARRRRRWVGGGESVELCGV